MCKSEMKKWSFLNTQIIFTKVECWSLCSFYPLLRYRITPLLFNLNAHIHVILFLEFFLLV